MISETVRLRAGYEIAVAAQSPVRVPLGADPKAPVLVLGFSGIFQQRESYSPEGPEAAVTATYVRASAYVQSHIGAVGEMAELTMTVPDAVRLGLVLGAEVVES